MRNHSTQYNKDFKTNPLFNNHILAKLQANNANLMWISVSNY